MKNSILFSEVLPDSTLLSIAHDLEVRIAERITHLVDRSVMITYLHAYHEMKAIKKMQDQVVCIRKYLAKSHRI